MSGIISKKKVLDYLIDRISTYNLLAKHAAENSGNYSHAVNVKEQAIGMQEVQLQIVKGRFDEEKNHEQL